MTWSRQRNVWNWKQFLLSVKWQGRQAWHVHVRFFPITWGVCNGLLDLYISDAGVSTFQELGNWLWGGSFTASVKLDLLDAEKVNLKPTLSISKLFAQWMNSAHFHNIDLLTVAWSRCHWVTFSMIWTTPCQLLLYQSVDMCLASRSGIHICT